jgi:hypothetical protein
MYRERSSVIHAVRRILLYNPKRTRFFGACDYACGRDDPHGDRLRACGFDRGRDRRSLESDLRGRRHVVYTPGLPNIEAIRTICRKVDKPVNMVMGLQEASYSVSTLSPAAGVKRISVGGSFARAALGAMMRAEREVLEQGTFPTPKLRSRTVSSVI